jgi:hypothetical protein
MKQNHLPRSTQNTRHNTRCSRRPISRITAFQMSGLGQKRKSSVGLGMSGVGGNADFDFGRLEVCLRDSDSLANSYVSMR